MASPRARGGAPRAQRLGPAVAAAITQRPPYVKGADTTGRREPQRDTMGAEAPEGAAAVAERWAEVMGAEAREGAAAVAERRAEVPFSLSPSGPPVSCRCFP